MQSSPECRLAHQRREPSTKGRARPDLGSKYDRGYNMSCVRPTSDRAYGVLAYVLSGNRNIVLGQGGRMSHLVETKHPS